MIGQDYRNVIGQPRASIGSTQTADVDIKSYADALKGSRCATPREVRLRLVLGPDERAEEILT